MIEGTRNIYLIGMMGVGKTTIGALLAQRLQWLFVDLDEVIERITEKSISEIFSEEGEEYFRDLESQAILQLDQEEPIVVSCGGGTPCFNDNLEVMNQRGLTIYLSAGINHLVNGLKHGHSARPLLEQLVGDEETLEDYLMELLESRSPFYEQADLTIDTESLNEEEVVSQIMVGLEGIY